MYFYHPIHIVKRNLLCYNALKDLFGGIPLKAIRRKIERFCYNHSRFGIPRLMLYIVIASAAVYLISMMDTTGSFIDYLSFSPYHILRGQIWRLVTWVIALPPVSGIFWTAISLYFYYFIGSTLENHWGTARFTVYYILGVLLNVIYGFIVWLITGNDIGINASYLNLSMFFAFAVLYPDQQVLLFFVIPIKIKWLAYLDAALFIYNIIVYTISGAYAYALLPIIAVINFFIFCGEDLMRYLKRSRIRNASNVVNFRSAVREAERKEAERPYRHKCAVCGRTDTDYPELEFRYCSRCQGYHCFCSDHINNHIHFTE